MRKHNWIRCHRFLRHSDWSQWIQACLLWATVKQRLGVASKRDKHNGVTWFNRWGRLEYNMHDKKSQYPEVDIQVEQIPSSILFPICCLTYANCFTFLAVSEIRCVVSVVNICVTLFFMFKIVSHFQLCTQTADGILLFSPLFQIESSAFTLH